MAVGGKECGLWRMWRDKKWGGGVRKGDWGGIRNVDGYLLVQSQGPGDVALQLTADLPQQARRKLALS